MRLQTIWTGGFALVLGLAVWLVGVGGESLHSQSPEPTPAPSCGIAATRTTPGQIPLNLNADGSRSVLLPAGSYIINAVEGDTVLFVCHVQANSSIRFDYRLGCELSRNVTSPLGTAVLNEIAAGGA